jgi:integrase
MSIKIRDDSGIWWLDFYDPRGKRIRKSCGTTDKKLAQEYHDRLKAELWRQDKLGERPRYSWQEAVVNYVGENQNQRSLKTTKENLRFLDKFLSDKRLDEITRKLIEEIKQEKIATGASVGSVNRMLTVLRAILNAAKHWDWLESPPVIKLLSDNTQRIRWLTHEQANALLAELPEHLKPIVMFALATGLRETNITGLQWSQVDMVRKCAWIHADQAKGKKAISVPLNDDAVTVIKAQIGKHLTHVFSYAGKNLHRANCKAWRKALKRAGINDFRFHDLRHTWASWHVQNGTPLHVLKELGGWADMSMVLRYAHLSGEHLQHYANNATLTLVTNQSQSENISVTKTA